MSCPNWVYRWVDRRGSIPWIVRRLWPTAHWCPEMDSLLIIDNVMDCFCGHCGERSRAERRHFRGRSRLTYEQKFFASAAERNRNSNDWSHYFR